MSASQPPIYRRHGYEYSHYVGGFSDATRNALQELLDTQDYDTEMLEKAYRLAVSKEREVRRFLNTNQVSAVAAKVVDKTSDAGNVDDVIIGYFDDSKGRHSRLALVWPIIRSEGEGCDTRLLVEDNPWYDLIHSLRKETDEVIDSLAELEGGTSNHKKWLHNRILAHEMRLRSGLSAALEWWRPRVIKATDDMPGSVVKRSPLLYSGGSARIAPDGTGSLRTIFIRSLTYEGKKDKEKPMVARHGSILHAIPTDRLPKPGELQPDKSQCTLESLPAVGEKDARDYFEKLVTEAFDAAKRSPTYGSGIKEDMEVDDLLQDELDAWLEVRDHFGVEMEDVEATAVLTFYGKLRRSTVLYSLRSGGDFIASYTSDQVGGISQIPPKNDESEKFWNDLIEKYSHAEVAETFDGLNPWTGERLAKKFAAEVTRQILSIRSQAGLRSRPSTTSLGGWSNRIKRDHGRILATFSPVSEGAADGTERFGKAASSSTSTAPFVEFSHPKKRVNWTPFTVVVRESA